MPYFYKKRYGFMMDSTIKQNYSEKSKFEMEAKMGGGEGLAQKTQV